MIIVFILLIAMTTTVQSQSRSAVIPAVEYFLAMPNPSTHLLDVEVRITAPGSPDVEFHMPAWRTGRYVIQDFSGGVQEFSARDENGTPLPWKKTDKDTWRVDRGSAESVTVRYKVYANEFNQRTRELNSEHAFIDPAAVFMYVEELKTAPLRLTVRPFGNWHVTTGLDEEPGTLHTFTAPEYEYFADCPLEIGTQTDIEFMAGGKKHIISIYGKGNWNRDTLAADFTRIILANKAFWGDLPYEKYVFQIHCQPNARGGTEHINSTIMGVPPFIFSNANSYKRFLNLVSHEYFHTWNVKQLRPKAFAPYDFSRESYSEELWISEGTTSYFDDLILLRAGYRTADEYLELIGQMIGSDRERFGNTIQPLAEASYDAWVKYWRNRQNSRNAESDYYGKGQHVSLLLDLHIRHSSGNRASLDDVMKAMVQRYPRTVGFTNKDFISVCEEFAGTSLKKFFDDYLFGTAPLEWERILGYAGLNVLPKDPSQKIALGASTHDNGDKVVVNGVFPGSPAENAGIEIQDEIIALNGYRLRSADMHEHIAAMKPGEEYVVTLFRNDKLREIRLTARPAGSPRFSVVKTAKPNSLQKSIFNSWLRTGY
ncbi:MAG: M61 family metallopeptidase [Bacteroidota bacterium]